MQNAVIYYCQSKEENSEISISYVNELIKDLEKQCAIKGVFVDNYNERTEFYNLINNSLDSIDLIYINNEVLDEFDRKLLEQVAKAEGIFIKLRD